ncbi:MAG: hypothetical protein ABRQ37_09305, partial [Candidatus Eremiobacterota bacterium]
ISKTSLSLPSTVREQKKSHKKKLPVDNVALGQNNSSQISDEQEFIRKLQEKKSSKLNDMLRCFFEALTSGGGLFSLTTEGLIIMSAILRAAQGNLASIPVMICEKLSGTVKEHTGCKAYKLTSMHEPYGTITDKKMSDISASKWRGETLWCGAGLFEDNHLMAVQVKKSDGSDKIKLTGKIDRDKDEFIRKFFEANGAIYEKGTFAAEKVKISKGKLVGNGTMEQTGNRFTMSLPSGITISYRPYEKNYSYTHGEDVNSLAIQGDIEIVSGQGYDIKNLLSEVGKALGVEIKEPLKGEMELLYLKKNITAMKLDGPEYRAMMEKWKEEPVSLETQVVALLAYLKKETSVDVWNLPSYKWEPVQDKVCDTPGGKPYWTGLYSDKYLDGNLKDFKLVHNNYSTDEVQAILDIFRDTGSLISTKDRQMSLGISNRGITSDRDMDVGAGNYAFFHLSRSSSRASLVLSNRPMERTDTVIHKVGKFGKVGEKDLDERITLDKAHLMPVYEVMVKDGVVLDHYLEKINVSSEENKSRLIEGLKSYGITSLNGKPLEDVIDISHSVLKHIHDKSVHRKNNKGTAEFKDLSNDMTRRDANITKTSDKPLQHIDETFMSAITSAGSEGYSYFTSGNHIEDGNILLEQKKDTFVMKMKLGETGNKEVLEAFKKAGISGENTKEGLHYTFTDSNGLEYSYYPVTENYHWNRPSEFTIITRKLPEKSKKLPEGVPPYALQGLMTVTAKGNKLNGPELSDIIEKTGETLHIDTGPATQSDMELTWLRKMALLYKAIDRDILLSCQDMPGEEERRYLIDVISERTGVNDITQLASYDPVPEMGNMYKKDCPVPVKGGWGYFKAPLLELEPELNNYYPFTYLHGNLKEILSSILDKEGLLCSRMERERLGVNKHGVGGLDMFSGGADYVFCHLEQDIHAGDLVFKPELLNRLDQIGHRSDQWGQVTPEADHTRIIPDDYHKNYMYEVMFKNSVNLLDYLERINVRSREEKEDIINLFKDRGFTSFGDKTLDELVQVKPEKQHLKEEIVHKLSFFNTLFDVKPVNRVMNKIASSIDIK